MTNELRQYAERIVANVDGQISRQLLEPTPLAMKEYRLASHYLATNPADGDELVTPAKLVEMKFQPRSSRDTFPSAESAEWFWLLVNRPNGSIEVTMIRVGDSRSPRLEAFLQVWPIRINQRQRLGHDDGGLHREAAKCHPGDYLRILRPKRYAQERINRRRSEDAEGAWPLETGTPMTTKLTDLTKREQEAIQELQRLAKKWPKSLWIFCGGSLGINVLKCNPDGSRMMTRTGGVDGDAIVASINGIQNDGGDF